MSWLFLLASLSFAGISGYSHAQDFLGVDDANRAKINYMLNCQGCHGPDGDGTSDGSVPQMKNLVGNFLLAEGGREFLVQVPGSANAALNNDHLAEVLNWMLYTQSKKQLPKSFQPYSAREVGKLRANPIVDVIGTRAALLKKLPKPLQQSMATH